ncbi:MAG: nitroreductase family deazaflavin-dependent oxidoreductase [Chloroflexi bacterium]|nr:nitroreductase family deazaflavin-dependent oxidoreductase [Chloroflexota bacterium]
MGMVDRKPTGWMRFLLRLPVGLFRAGLGWLLLGHFLMVITRGRFSGQARYTVIEVIQRDRTTGGYVVVAGWGAKCDWFLNLLKTPAVQIIVGFRKFPTRAEVIEPDRAAEFLVGYSARHPSMFRIFARALTGDTPQGTLEERRRIVAISPLVVFHPITGQRSSPN